MSCQGEGGAPFADSGPQGGAGHPHLRVVAAGVSPSGPTPGWGWQACPASKLNRFCATFDHRAGRPVPRQAGCPPLHKRHHPRLTQGLRHGMPAPTHSRLWTAENQPDLKGSTVGPWPSELGRLRARRKSKPRTASPFGCASCMRATPKSGGMSKSGEMPTRLTRSGRTT